MPRRTPNLTFADTSVQVSAWTSALASKLAGIATGATANDTDANLRARSTHTGEQAISTVTSLQTALDGKATSAEITSAIAAERLFPAVSVTTSSNLDAFTGGSGLDFNGSNLSLIIRTNATAAIPVNTQFVVSNFNSTNLTVDASTGVSLNGTSAQNLTIPQWGSRVLRKTATDTWFLAGTA